MLIINQIKTKRFTTENNNLMSFLKRIFNRPKSTNNKPGRPDSPTNKVIKKFLFYGFFLFTTATIISKKYKTNLIFTFQPNQQNKQIIQHNSVFHQGVYNPVYWMLFGPMQRVYAKYFEQIPYFRANMELSSRQVFQTHELPVHDKYAKKEGLSVALLIAGCQGVNTQMQKLMNSMNNSGFKTVCINPDDFHNVQKLTKTVKKIKIQNPNSKVFAIGVDYGANLLVNFAAKNQKILNGLVSLGNPLDLEQAQKKIENSNFIWKKLLYGDILQGRIKSCEKNRQLFGQKLKISTQNTSLYELDRTCYDGIYEDYPSLKHKLSSINSIKDLKVPSLFIQSQQDPFSISIEQNQQKLQNSHCIFVQTQRGGHLQWFQSMKKIRWVSRPITQFFKYLDGRF